MKNAGLSMAIVGVWTVCLSVGSEPIVIKAGIVGLVVLVVGLAMVLYQSYRDEEEEEQESQRRRTFHNWLYTTDLKETGRDETGRI